METVQQNGRFTLFSSKFPSNIYSIIFDSYDQNISLIFYLKDGSHVRLWHPYFCVLLEPKESTLQYKKIVKH